MEEQEKESTEHVIEDIKDILEKISDSQSIDILRDLCDDPFEPFNLNICGLMYSYKSARLEEAQSHKEEDYTEKREIILSLERYSDLVDGVERVYEFPVSYDFLVEYRNGLKEYFKERG